MPVVDVQVGASSDDGEEVGVVVDLTAAWITLYGTGNDGGWRWTGVNIPAGANIVTAYVTIYIEDWPHDRGDGKTLYLENNNNPPTFVAVDGNISNRPKTSGVALPAGNLGAGWEQLPSIVAQVQAVVDGQGGTGDALVALIRSFSNWDLGVRTWDGNPDQAAQLYIAYTVPRIPRGPATGGIDPQVF